mmetsp:Transcript_9073/g.19445  ORF Transcript_9073/g.19445 Transcript_9073/m.19445 type:complete len:382 (+) Transcript_9073:158-1303(+)
MEGAKVERGTKSGLGPSPHLLQRQLPHLIAASLPRPSGVAVALLATLVGGHACLLLHVGSGTLHAPTELVDAGVNHQSHRAHHLKAQAAEELLRRCVQTHLLTERLAVEGPALQVGGVEGAAGRAELVAPVLDIAKELGEILVLQSQRTLQMMSWHPFVERQGHHLIFCALVQARLVHVEAARALPIGCAREVVGSGSAVLGNHFQRHIRQLRKDLREPLPDLCRHGAVTIQEFLFGSVEEARVLLEALGKLCEGSFKFEDIEHFLLEASLDARHLLQADVMDFLCGLGGGGVEAKALSVHLRAIPQGLATRFLPHAALVNLFDEVEEAAERALEAILDGLVDLLNQLGVQLLPLHGRRQLRQVAVDELLEAIWHTPHHRL